MKKKIGLMSLACILLVTSCASLQSSLRQYDYKDAELLETEEEILDFIEEIKKYYDDNKEQLKHEDFTLSSKYYFSRNKSLGSGITINKLGEKIDLEVDYDNNIYYRKTYSYLSEVGGEDPNSLYIWYKDENNQFYHCDNEDYEFVPSDNGYSFENNYYDWKMQGSYSFPVKSSYPLFGALGNFADLLKYPEAFTYRKDMQNENDAIQSTEYFIYSSSYGNFKIEVKGSRDGIKNRTICVFENFRIVYSEFSLIRKGASDRSYTKISYKDVIFSVPNV